MSINYSEELLRGVDMSENMKLYHMKNDSIKGVIFDYYNKLIISNFSVPQERVIVELSQETIDQLEYPIECFSSIEGTLIRVYYHDNTWNISTSSRIDAYSSFWSSKNSFGLQFQTCVESITGSPLDVFLNSLDVNIKYFFILPTMGTNRLGRIPDNVDTNFYLVGIYKDSKYLCGTELDQTEINAWSYLKKYTIYNFDELFDLVENKHTNLIVYKSFHDLTKLYYESYSNFIKLRNNEPNLLYRYIELIQTDKTSANELVKMYPEIKFDLAIERKLGKIFKYIHTSYIARYIKREYITIPKIFYYIMSKCHKKYLETRTKTTLKEIEDIIMKEEPKIILSLIRNFSLKE